jgi:hypothetical protein
MDPQLEQQIKERFMQLSPDIQRAIQSSDTEEKLRRIGEEYKLHIDQVGALGDEVRLVMLGFADPEKFSGTLIEQAHISVEEASKIADEVAEKIFQPIRESMQRFMEERELDEVAETTETRPASEPSNTLPAIKPPPVGPMNESPFVGRVDEPGKQPAVQPSMPMAEKILTQPTVAPPAATNPNPRLYKTDPYREPAE